MSLCSRHRTPCNCPPSRPHSVHAQVRTPPCHLHGLCHLHGEGTLSATSCGPLTVPCCTPLPVTYTDPPPPPTAHTGARAGGGPPPVTYAVAGRRGGRRTPSHWRPSARTDRIGDLVSFNSAGPRVAARPHLASHAVACVAAGGRGIWPHRLSHDLCSCTGGVAPLTYAVMCGGEAIPPHTTLQRAPVTEAEEACDGREGRLCVCVSAGNAW